MFRHTSFRLFVLTLLAAAALFTAVTAAFFGLDILTEIIVLCIVVLALDSVAGFGGMVSLCHGALMGVEAHAYALLSATFVLSPLAAMAAAIAVTGIAGWVAFTSNNADVDNFGIGILLQTLQVKRMISFNVGESALCMRPYLAGELEVEEV